MTATPPTAHAAPQSAARRPTGATRSAGRRFTARWWLVTGALTLAVMLLVRGWVGETVYVASDSMAPGLRPGDRLVVSKLGSTPHRGDLIVFDGSDTFAPPSSPPAAHGALSRALEGVRSVVGLDTAETDYVKRVIGVPGDRVTCCDTEGRLSVNGVAVHEGYLPAGEWASDLQFDIVVPDGRLWVMGDNRSVSRDSRAMLGAPGGGTVPVEDVVGEPVMRFWPLADAAPLHGDAELRDIPVP